jgi:hypothetical protein
MEHLREMEQLKKNQRRFDAKMTRLIDAEDVNRTSSFRDLIPERDAQ